MANQGPHAADQACQPWILELRLCLFKASRSVRRLEDGSLKGDLRGSTLRLKKFSFREENLEPLSTGSTSTFECYGMTSDAALGSEKVKQ